MTADHSTHDGPGLLEKFPEPATLSQPLLPQPFFPEPLPTQPLSPPPSDSDEEPGSDEESDPDEGPKSDEEPSLRNSAAFPRWIAPRKAGKAAQKPRPRLFLSPMIASFMA